MVLDFHKRAHKAQPICMQDKIRTFNCFLLLWFVLVGR